MTEDRRPNGFTLLELLIALTVLGFLFAGLAQGVHFGLLAWATEAHLTGGNDEFNTLDNTLRHLIEVADPGDDLDSAPLAANRDRLDCITATAECLWRGAGPTHSGDVAGRCRPPADAALAPSARATRLGPPEPTETELLRGVSRIELAFWRPAESGSHVASPRICRHWCASACCSRRAIHGIGRTSSPRRCSIGHDTQRGPSARLRAHHRPMVACTARAARHALLATSRQDPSLPEICAMGQSWKRPPTARCNRQSSACSTVQSALESRRNGSYHARRTGCCRGAHRGRGGQGQSKHSLGRSCCRRCLCRSVQIHVTSAAVAASIVEWRLASGTAARPSATVARYAAAGRDYAPSGAPFESPDELGARARHDTRSAGTPAAAYDGVHRQRPRAGDA